MIESLPRKPPPRSKRAGRRGGRVFLLLGLLACLARPTFGQLPSWNDASEKAWWATHPALAQQSAAIAEVRALVQAAYRKDGAAVFSNPDFQGWLDHLQWLQLGAQSSDLLSTPANLQTYIALGCDDRLSHQLVEKMEPGDAGPAALALMLRLAQANMADLHEYAALGIAYCLVFDSPFPRDWPHDQVAPSAVPVGDVDVVPRFQFYVAANRAHKTALDLTQQTFENLKFLVDSEVKLSELAYGQTNTTPYSEFVSTFFSIKYDHLRVSSGNDIYSWNLNNYNLKTIEQAGGICVDQAYYACMIGKARGIPTIFFTGLGDEGAHAWFGYLDRSGAWQLDCGRYEEQNFAKGYALDPQTWQELKDTSLEQFIQHGVKDPAYPAAKAALSWARLQGDDPAAKSSYDDAHTIMPSLAETWQSEADFMDRIKVSPDDQKSFYQDWINTVAAFPDQKVEAQKRYVAELRKTNDPTADDVEQDIILQNRTGGVDLAVQGSEESIDDRFNARDWDGARMEFERAVRDFADKGGATFYYRVVDPYIRRCMSTGQINQAQLGLQFTEDRTKLDASTWRGPTTISSDFDRLKERVDEARDGLKAIQDWLAELDGGQAEQAWNDSSTLMQQAVPCDKWTSDMTAERQKWGSVVSRRLTSLEAHDWLRMPDGKQESSQVIEAKFETVCDAQRVTEKVSFEKADGKWQAFSYTPTALASTAGLVDGH